MEVDAQNKHLTKWRGPGKKRPRSAKFVKKQKVEVNPSVPNGKSRGKSFINSPRRRSPSMSSRYDLLNKLSPTNLRHLLFTSESPLYLKSIRADESTRSSAGIVYIPEVFSLCDNLDETIRTLKQIVSALFVEENNTIVYFDYAKCHKIGIEAQAVMDIILSEFRIFLRKCSHQSRHKECATFPLGFGGQNILDEDLQKLLFSVGSPANLGIKAGTFEDVLKLPMRSHNALTKRDREYSIIQKDIDTTQIVDHVIACLGKMKKTLTPEKKNDFSTVVGEILINAEEHSSFKHRFSMAYFQERNNDGHHFGLFRFVILNFGATIYDSFRDNALCPPDIIEKMRALSQRYTESHLFRKNQFEEETLWTLYALQQGVTSVPGKRRGSGTIQFIRSFFNIKGSLEADNISKMVILSGNTEIVFDGEYGITERIEGNKKFDMMTFNDSGRIEDAPDPKYVHRTNVFFPGTIITANILLNEDDVEEINN